MSKDKLPDNKELKEPHFKGLPNDKNSFGSKDKSMIPNADSKENDKGSSCNSLVKPAVSSPLGIDGHNCSVHGRWRKSYNKGLIMEVLVNCQFQVEIQEYHLTLETIG